MMKLRKPPPRLKLKEEKPQLKQLPRRELPPRKQPNKPEDKRLKSFV